MPVYISSDYLIKSKILSLSTAGIDQCCFTLLYLGEHWGNYYFDLSYNLNEIVKIMLFSKDYMKNIFFIYLESQTRCATRLRYTPIRVLLQYILII